MSVAAIMGIVAGIIGILKGIFGYDKPIKLTESIATGQPVGPVIAAQLRALRD